MRTPIMGDIVLVASIAPGASSAEAVPAVITSVIGESAPDVWTVTATTIGTPTQAATIHGAMSLYASAESADADREGDGDAHPVYAILRPETLDTLSDAESSGKLTAANDKRPGGGGTGSSKSAGGASR